MQKHITLLAITCFVIGSGGTSEVWAQTTAMRVDAKHYEADLLDPYENRILMSFESPSMRFEARSASIDSVRGIVGDKGWYVSKKTPLRPMTDEQVTDDLRWWEAHIYRTVHRIARRDRELTVQLASDGRLLVKLANGAHLMWIRQNARGEPIQFGVGEAATGTIFGPVDFAKP